MVAPWNYYGQNNPYNNIISGFAGPIDVRTIGQNSNMTSPKAPMQPSYPMDEILHEQVNTPYNVAQAQTPMAQSPGMGPGPQMPMQQGPPPRLTLASTNGMFSKPEVQQQPQMQQQPMGQPMGQVPRPNENPIFQDIKANVQGEIPMDDMPRPRQYQPLTVDNDPLMRDFYMKALQLGNPVRDSSMDYQPGHPMANALRAVSLGLRAYTDVRRAREGSGLLVGNLGGGGRGSHLSNEMQRANQASKLYLDSLDQKSEMLATYATMRQNDEAAYEHNVNQAGKIYDMRADRATRPYAATSTYMQGYQRETAGDKNAAMAQQIPATQLSVQNRNNSSSALSDIRGQHIQDMQPFQIDNIEERTRTSAAQGDLAGARQKDLEIQSPLKAKKTEGEIKELEARTKAHDVRVANLLKQSRPDKTAINQELASNQRFIDDAQAHLKNNLDTGDIPLTPERQKYWMAQEQERVRQRAALKAKLGAGGESTFPTEKGDSSTTSSWKKYNY